MIGAGRFFALLTAGFVIWASGFVLLYAAHATGCALGWHETPFGPVPALRALLLGLLALHLAALGGVEILRRRTAPGAPVLRYSLIAAALSMLFGFVAVIWLPLC